MRSLSLRFVLFGAAAVVVGHLLGIDYEALVSRVGSDVDRAADDIGALFNGDYKQRVASRHGLQVEAALRQEAARLPAGNDELNRELMAERRRLLEAKAERAGQVMDDLAHGDMESLRRQAEKNARVAGGNN